MLLPVPNVRQQQPADCLVACAAMVLAYLKVHVTYNRIRRILGTSDIGTPFHRLERLSPLDVTVIVGEGDIGTLRTHVESDFPVIVDVRTWTLSHWRSRTDIQPIERDTQHSAVVVGLDPNAVYINDPDFDPAPQVVSLDAFMAAWLERDQRYAVIRLPLPQ